MTPRSLAAGFVRHVTERDWWSGGDAIVVACSGGVDSSVLLHLLRFADADATPRLVAAHFDHAMRPGSGADALWTKGLCSAWGIDFHTERADAVLRSEAEAREARYAFLDRVRDKVGARWVLTAHQADDQAETVLFRALRGAGLRGLAGIPEQREPGILRPILPFTRSEIEEYAEGVGLSAREDETNASPAFARNVIRNELLPRAEEGVAAGARRSLVRLSGIAREELLAWESALPVLIRDVVQSEDDGVTHIERSRLLSYHAGVRKRILRHLAREFGFPLDERATSVVDAFIETGGSGRTITVGGGLRLSRSFGSIVLRRPATGVTEDRTLTIVDPSPGGGHLSLGGRRYEACWAVGRLPEWRWVEHFPWPGLGAPATLRAWLPGDRIFMSFGSKKLKKLFAEARIPAHERVQVPVLANARGEIVWVPGIARARNSDSGDSDIHLSIAIQEAL